MTNPYAKKKRDTTTEKLLKYVALGRLFIPYGTEEIPDHCFDSFIHDDQKLKLNTIVSIKVPGTVKRIGDRAFAEMKNLRKIQIEEGVEEIGSNAFTECKKLKTITLPSTVKKITGWAFYESGLKEPVFSADGKTLIYYPQCYTNTSYVIPEGVEKIEWQAFIEMKGLKEVTFPSTIKCIGSRAFIDCGFEEINIPEGVEVQLQAFYRCKQLKKIHIDWIRDPVERRLKLYEIQGFCILGRVKYQLPSFEYWHTELFVSLAQKCAKGDVNAMDAMTDYFYQLSKTDPDTLFYSGAFHFWVVRSMLYGSEKGTQYFREFAEKTPDEITHWNSPYISENLSGLCKGRYLNALGFLFFEEDREYYLSGKDKDGAVRAESFSYCDGYGNDDIYNDYWYLDDCLILPKDVSFIHDKSDFDMRESKWLKEEYKKIHDQVVESIKKRKQLNQ